MHPETRRPTVLGAAHALEPTDGPLLPEELQLAFRNRGMPLEAMRHDLTPTGLHYLVAHWDIPLADPATWRLTVGGRVRRPLELTLERASRSPAPHAPGHARVRRQRARLADARARSACPWLGEAIGTAEWTGTPLRGLLEDAGLGRRRGRGRVPRRRPRDPGRARSSATPAASRARGDPPRGPARLRDERAPARAAARLPAPPHRPGLVRDDEREVADVDRGGDRAVRGLPAGRRLSLPARRRRSRRPRLADPRPGAHDPARDPRLLLPPPVRRRRSASTLSGRAWSGDGPVERVEVAVDGRWADATLAPPVGEFAWRGWSFDWDATAGEHELACRATDAAGNVQPLGAAVELPGHGQQRRPAHPRRRPRAQLATAASATPGSS